MVDLLDTVEILRALCAQHGQELVHHARHDHGVVGSAVVVKLRQAEVVGYDVQLEALELGQQRLAKRERIEKDRGEFEAAAQRGGGHEAHVEMRVVGNERAVAGVGHELLHGLLLQRRVLHVAVPDAGQLRDVRRDRLLGIDEGVEGALDLSAGKDDGADLGHALVLGVEAGGLDVEGDELGVERELRLADDGGVAVHVVDEVGLHAVDNLDAVLFPGLPHIREGLRHPVVGDSDGGHAPVGRALDGGGGVGERVEGGEAGVKVQLHALDLGLVRAHGAPGLHDAARLEHHVVVVF